MVDLKVGLKQTGDLSILPRLYERDIDVVLQEELIFNPAVRDLFGKALKLSGFEIRRCALSVSDASGETDVFAFFACENGLGVLLIENKIDAAFQPRQPERYQERAQALMSQMPGHKAFCVLVAPERYLGSEQCDTFDQTITYEEIAHEIESQGSDRAKYRASLLRRAIEQAAATYVMVPAPAVGDLWQRVYQIACAEYPQLKMSPPGEKGPNSSWITLKANLPPKVTLDWKIPKGVVDLSFWSSAQLVPRKDLDLRALPGATQQQAGATSCIRLPFASPPPDWKLISDDHTRQALQTADRLLGYYHANSAAFVKRL